MRVFIFQLVGVELKTNQIMLHVASPDADTQGLPFFVPCTPPTSFVCVCVCVFFLVPRRSGYQIFNRCFYHSQVG